MAVVAEMTSLAAVMYSNIVSMGALSMIVHWHLCIGAGGHLLHRPYLQPMASIVPLPSLPHSLVNCRPFVFADSSVRFEFWKRHSLGRAL